MLKTQLGVFVPTRRKIRLAGAGLQLLAAATLALAAGSNAAYSQTTIPASFAAPAGSVDLTKPGFRLKIVQGPATPTFPNTSARAEGQLNGTYLDPATSAPYPNEADLTAAGADGYFVITNVINFTGDAGSAGNFQPDDPIPGIPGTTGHTDNIAGEILTFLDLPAGTNTFGFNSDDGFRMTIGVGRNPKDAFAQQVGIFEGGRGASDTIYSFVISQAGLYPVRIIWYEGGGGANFELFSFPGGVRTLVNDPADPAATKAYREASGAVPPYATSVTPAFGATGVSAKPRISVTLLDQGTTVNTNNLFLALNGTTLASTITKVGSNTTITAISPTVLPAGSINTARIIYGDSAGSITTNTWQFTVGNYKTLPAGFAHPSASIDTSSSGFQTYIVQADATPTLPNTTARAESQLAGTYIDPVTGLPYANVATPGPAGTTRFTNVVINFTGDATSAGNFQPDDPIPGIPGTTGSTDSIAGEFVTFLKLDPGVYTFGVNSDDGFRVTSGLNPRSSSALELGVFEGGRGASDTLFDVVVTNSGIYPIRLIWYEGGGGANVEFFTVTATGEKILINDRANANAVTAYLTSTLTLPPIVQSVSPADGSRAARGTDNVVIRLADQTSSVVSNSIVLTFNGATVTPTISQVGGITTITYDPPGDLARASSNFVRFVFQDNATPANRFTNTFNFIVGGELTRKVYDDIGGGTAVSDLTGSAKYIENQPDVVDLVSLFETPPDVANNYGAEILGYFTPSVNEAYTFYLSADDGAVLYLSTDASPANRVQIAVQPSWNGSREYLTGNNPALRKSAPQNLIAGQRYFIHALFKEGGGGDNLAVAVRTSANPTIANGDAPIAGPEISPFVGVDFVVNPRSQTILVGRPVTFNGQAIAGSGGGMVYQFLRNGVPITDATNTSYTIPSVASTDNGALFSVRATAGTNVATSAAATLTVNNDTVIPTITGVGALTNNLIGVCFSEVVRTAGATNPANYTVSGATVTDARLSADGMTVFLTVTPVGASYTVSAINQTDLAGNPVSSTAVPGTVNSSYINIDLGGPAEVGSAVTCGNGDFEITAGGNDIWGNADQEHFVGQLITGDFDKRVRVEYLEPVNRWSKAGLQVREDLDGDSRALTAYVSPSAVPTQDGDGGGIGNNIYEAGRRSAKAGGTDAWHTSNPPPPYPNAWIRVSRVGNVFTGYWGTNGTDWTQFARSIPTPVYPAAVYFGLALTAHNDPGDPTTAGFTADASFRSYSDVIGGARFNQPVLDPATRNVTISWVGAGRLQESTTVNGTYTDSPDQSNPQTRTATTGFRFFRLISP